MRVHERLRRAEAAAVAEYRQAQEPFWCRHPHVMGVVTFAVVVALGLMLGGCECGVGWPCPREP